MNPGDFNKQIIKLQREVKSLSLDAYFYRRSLEESQRTNSKLKQDNYELQRKIGLLSIELAEKEKNTV